MNGAGRKRANFIEDVRYDNVPNQQSGTVRAGRDPKGKVMESENVDSSKRIQELHPKEKESYEGNAKQFESIGICQRRDCSFISGPVGIGAPGNQGTDFGGERTYETSGGGVNCVLPSIRSVQVVASGVKESTVMEVIAGVRRGIQDEAASAGLGLGLQGTGNDWHIHGRKLLRIQCKG